MCGLGFIARRNFFVGDIIDISILLPSGSFVIEAEVVRSNNTVKGMEYGVHFTRQDELMQKEISELIENIKEREDRLSHIAGMSVM